MDNNKVTKVVMTYEKIIDNLLIELDSYKAFQANFDLLKEASELKHELGLNGKIEFEKKKEDNEHLNTFSRWYI